MKSLIMATALLLAASANAEITGPTTSTTGTYEITWTQTDYLLWEYQASWEYADHVHMGGTTGPITRPNGTYQYAVLECTVVPFLTYYCWALSHHQVYVVIGAPPGVEYPQTPAEQAAYEYEIRAGDFTGNGRVDLLVDRLTIGAMDGSQQTFILHQNLNGSLSLVAPTAAQLTHARSFPLAPAVTMVPVDMNGDGYIDHTLQNLTQVMGASVTDEYLVFAPGPTGWKGAPLAIRAIDDDVRSFVDDLGRWFNNAAHFSENAQVTYIPIYRLGYQCGLAWHYDEVGLRPSIQCGWGLVIVGWRVVVTGVNLNALVAAAHIQTAFEGMVDTDLSDGDLWQLSQVVKAMFGVQAFGFADNGVRYSTNHGADSPVEERESALGAFLESYLRWGVGFPLVLYHDYSKETVICHQNDPGCNLTNVACWGRRYPAPYQDREEHLEQVVNGATKTLTGLLGSLGGPGNPVRIFTGTSNNPLLAEDLEQHAVANITQPGHVFHNPDSPGPLGCPKQPLAQGSWQSSPWNGCTQVYRVPRSVGSGHIVMRTRGYGFNRYAALNDLVGPALFRRLDVNLRSAMSDASGGSCGF